VTNYNGIFEIGSLPLIHGKISTLLVNPTTKGPQPGSWRVRYFQSGKHLDGVPCCGCMGNVSGRLPLTLSQRLIILLPRSGRRKECSLVRETFGIISRKFMVSASSTIIQEIEAMQKRGFASLAFYYYDFREDKKKDLRGLLSSFLSQLCDQSDSYSDVLSNFYSTHHHGAQSPSDHELARCLRDLLELSGQAPVYLVVDALDECPITPDVVCPRDKVLMLLEDLVDSKSANLRICVTSRPEADIKVVLEPLTFRSISIHDENGQMKDIENYIRSTVNSHKKMRRWKQEHKQLVIDVLTARADGMYEHLISS